MALSYGRTEILSGTPSSSLALQSKPPDLLRCYLREGFAVLPCPPPPRRTGGATALPKMPKPACESSSRSSQPTRDPRAAHRDRVVAGLYQTRIDLPEAGAVEAPALGW